MLRVSSSRIGWDRDSAPHYARVRVASDEIVDDAFPMRLAPLGLTLLIATSACRQSTEPPVPLTVSIQANTTVVPRGDTVTFTVTAAGNNLFGAMIDYGDQTGDQYGTGGALSARITFKHAYDAAGTYTVTATVTDAVAGEREATIAVVVN